MLDRSDLANLGTKPHTSEGKDSTHRYKMIPRMVPITVLTRIDILVKLSPDPVTVEPDGG